MLRHERRQSPKREVSCCVRRGGCPAAVSAGALCRRPRVREEIPSPERGVESPRKSVRPHGRGATWRAQCVSVNPAASRHKQSKGRTAEPVMSRRRQQTAPERAVWVLVVACDEVVVADTTGGVQDVPGVWGRARGKSLTRTRRDPTRRLISAHEFKNI